MKQMNKSDSFFIGTDSQIKTDSGVGPTMNLGFTPYTGKSRYNKTVQLGMMSSTAVVFYFYSIKGTGFLRVIYMLVGVSCCLEYVQ